MSQQSDEELIKSTGYVRWYMTLIVVLGALIVLTWFHRDITTLLTLTISVPILMLQFINRQLSGYGAKIFGFFINLLVVGALITLIFTGFDIGYVFDLLWPSAVILVGYAYLSGTIDIIREKIYSSWESSEADSRKKATVAVRTLNAVAVVTIISLILLWIV